MCVKYVEDHISLENRYSPKLCVISPDVSKIHRLCLLSNIRRLIATNFERRVQKNYSTRPTYGQMAIIFGLKRISWLKKDSSQSEQNVRKVTGHWRTGVESAKWLCPGHELRRHVGKTSETSNMLKWGHLNVQGNFLPQYHGRRHNRSCTPDKPFTPEYPSSLANRKTTDVAQYRAIESRWPTL